MTAKEIAHAWLPPAIYGPAVRWFREHRATSAQDRDLLARNAWIRDRYQKQKCFVLANGPSLRDIDLARLADQPTIVMNHFNQHQAFGDWQPTFHCAAEPVERYHDEAGSRSLNRMLSGYTKTVHVFPIGARPELRERGVPEDRLVFFRADGRTAAEFSRIDFTQAVPIPHDTSILAVSLAIALGCDPIILLGLDYDFLSHRSVNRHFYDDEAASLPVEDMGAVPYVESLRSAIPCWVAHAALHSIAAGNGQRIMNASRDSFLDTYPFVEFDHALASNKNG